MIDNNTVTSSYGHTIQQATHRREKTPIGRTTLTTYGNNFDQAGKIVEIGTKANNDPRNLDGTFQNIIWHAIDHKYYRLGYDPGYSFGGSNRNTIEKVLFLSASTFTLPYYKVGESIKPGTVVIEDTQNPNYPFSLYVVE